MKCSFIKQSFKVYCGNYGCHSRASWEVGNPEGPASLRLQLCDDCAKKLATNGMMLGLVDIPEEAQSPDSPEKTSLVGDPEPNVYPCEYCGKEFDNKKSRDMHSIRCPKKEGGK
jgi:hypothetical protein